MSTVMWVGAKKEPKEIALQTFSKECILKHGDVKASQLMENDPEDEDNTWDFVVNHGVVYTTATLIAPDGVEDHYVGLTTDWEGVKTPRD